MEGTAEKNWNEPLGSFTQKKTQHRDWRYFEIFQTILKQQKDTQFATSTTV